MAATYGDVRHLLPNNYKNLITSWLEEDCPSLDYGGFVVGESEGEARLLGKSKVISEKKQLEHRISILHETEICILISSLNRV